MTKLSTALLRTSALAILLGSFAVPAPVHAQSSDSSMAPAAAADAPAASDDMAPAPATGKGPMHDPKGHGMMNVEARIKTLHDKLMITSAQEGDWSKVAQTMRDNETSIHQLIDARHSNPGSMSAIDDLNSYQQIAQAHADGAQKMSSAFQTLYNEMSDAQKKNADQVFGSFEGHGGHMHKKPNA